MKERGILYSAPMVLAKLAGVKTQTRRMLKPQPGKRFMGELRDDWEWKCPYGEPGDRLWTRETWAVRRDRDEVKIRDLEPKLDGPWYRADGEEPSGCAGGIGKWRPSIFMPRWASRLLDEIVSVRVERLQDISEADAKAEGAAWRISPGGDLAGAFEHANAPIGYRNHYREVWEGINGAGSWKANPWVWAVETKPIGVLRG